MPQHVIKQPNGKYAIFSSVVDHFIAYDASVEEVYAHFRELAVAESERQTKRGIEQADQFGSVRFIKDLDTVRLIHGDQVADEYKALLSAPQMDTPVFGDDPMWTPKTATGFAAELAGSRKVIPIEFESILVDAIVNEWRRRVVALQEIIDRAVNPHAQNCLGEPCSCGVAERRKHWESLEQSEQPRAPQGEMK